VCVPEVRPDEPGQSPDDPVGTRSKRRQKSTKAREQGGFKPIDDSHIPVYAKKQVQHIDLNAGSERLDDFEVSRHMKRLESQFNRCIEVAAERSEVELAAGTIALEFGIAPSGKVTAVSAKAPKDLDVFGIVPCVRDAVYRHKFPGFDGPEMGVDYSFRVG
jgi:hypothetical protein